MPGALASTAANIGLNFAANKLMGGGKSGSKSIGGPTIPQFSAGGLDFRYGANGTPYIGYSSSTDPRYAINPRVEALNALKSSYADQSGAITSMSGDYRNVLNSGIQSVNDQLGLVKPGFGAITDAVVKSILDQGTQRTSDLRSSLAKRRVLGSSFGDNALNAQSLDVSKQLAEAKATSFLQELDASNKLITQKYNMQTQGLKDLHDLSNEVFNLNRAGSQLELDEQNTMLNLMSGLISSAISQEGANARTEADLAAKSAASRGAGIASMIKPLSDAAGPFLQGIFS